MPIYSYKELLKTVPRNKAYVVDTSFLIRALEEASEASKLKKLLIENGCLLAHNVTVKSEAMHYMRVLMFDAAFEQQTYAFTDALKKLWNETLPKLGHENHAALKQLSLGGYVDIFQIIFGPNGEKLDAEVTKLLAGCIYADTKSFKVPLEWSRMQALMATYGLDSSDAMILNLAVSDRTFSGIISADEDFIHCADSLDVILPGSRNQPRCKPCLVE